MAKYTKRKAMPNATITGGDSRPVHGLVGETNQEDRT
jgi:hypothetical protein